ncbi:MAG: L,D-transpeptidase [Bdellovibrio sp.]|nr:L,D-transpeptidase [Bdellovibrio sp.]
MKRGIFNFILILSAFSFLTRAAHAAKLIPGTQFCSNMQLIDTPKEWQDGQVPTSFKADHLVVSKERKKLYLLSEGRLIKEYKVSFGFNYKDGAKDRSGDGRTPEGLYEINLKKAKNQTAYHMALQVSYPNKLDLDYAAMKGWDAGSDILIHGLPSRPVDHLIPDVIKNVHAYRDWTQGCMAVTNQEIEEIFELVETSVPLEICPLPN